jgi:hypothetical protein
MLKRLAVAVVLFASAPHLGAQEVDVRLYVRKEGPGSAGDVLSGALEKPYIVLHQDWNTPIYGGREYNTNVVVLSSDATVAGTIKGDLIVINGSINLTASARIEGRAMAFGGNIYDVEGAVVTGKRIAYPAARFDTVQTPKGLALDYHGPPPPERDILVLPGIYGFTEWPMYDRVDGLSLELKPELHFGDSTLIIAPGVTYRSNLGDFDAQLAVRARYEGAFISVAGAQATLTNDQWIQTDFANSFAVLCCGKDFRNYWRAKWAEAKVGYAWSDTAHTISLWVGARREDATSVTAGGPWSITGDTSTFSMYRPNPAVDEERLQTWLTGISGTLDGTLVLKASLQVEIPFGSQNNGGWTQLVADVTGKLPTYTNQELTFRLHAIYTTGDSAAPPQRYGYLGGAGSVATLSLLGQGGDQLLFVEGDYGYTFEGIQIPYSTPPTLSLAYTAGAAGVQNLPKFTQNIGARLELKPFRLDFWVDPKTGQTKTTLLLWFIR